MSRKEELEHIKRLNARKIVNTNDIIKTYPIKRDKDGLILCPFCNKSDCLRKNQHEWYCTKTKQYINFKGVKYL